MSYFFQSIFIFAGIAISAACHSFSATDPALKHVAPTKAENRVSQQLIIKFKPSTIACSAKAILEFSNEVRERLDFVRPMSGDACVIVHHAVNTSALLEGQQKLKKHPSIQWLDMDEAMQIH